MVTKINLVNHILAEVLVAGTKAIKETVTFLAGAVKLTNRDPKLLSRFVDTYKTDPHRSAQELLTRQLSLSPDILRRLQESITHANASGLQQLRLPPPASDRDDFDNNTIFRKPWSEADARDRSLLLSIGYRRYLQRQETQEVQTARAKLPVNRYRKQILDLVAQGTYCIIVSKTGSGKTTQIPQILLEQASEEGCGGYCRIVCTQPRRIAATSVAQRVAEERCEELGESVGYHVRGDAIHACPGGSITFCTTGLFLQQLKSGVDHIFDITSHIIVDEVHERDVLIDFLLVVLKTSITTRKQAGKRIPRVILMSATIDTNLFADYFKQENSDGVLVPCPAISIPGRLFPVRHQDLNDIVQSFKLYPTKELSEFLEESTTRKYLRLERSLPAPPETTRHLNWQRLTTPKKDQIFEEDYDAQSALVPVHLIALTIAHVAKTTGEGSILVFLPGKQEIEKVRILLLQHPLGVEFINVARFKITMLHSDTPHEEQSDVFVRLPLGCRRIILATNIAETSLTISDVQHVIDSGKHREKQYGHTRGIDGLLCTWASQNNCKQRAGRAGRVCSGAYYALFTKERFNLLRPTQLPGIRRTDLQTVCLAAKAHGPQMSIKDFLGSSIEPPSAVAIDAAITRLVSLGALSQNSQEELTPLGHVLSIFPIKPCLAKMVIMGAIFRCLDSMVVLAAIADSRPIFIRPLNKKDEAMATEEKFMCGTNSEHIAKLHAFKRWQQCKEDGWEFAKGWAYDNYLNMKAVIDVERSCNAIHQNLIDSGIIPKYSISHRPGFGPQYGDFGLNENSHNLWLVRALLLSSLSPNLAIHLEGRNFRTANENSLIMSYGSLFSETKSVVECRDTIFVASSLAKSDSNDLMLREVTEVTPLITALFGGPFTYTTKSNTTHFEIASWLRLKIRSMDREAAEAVLTLVQFREALDKVRYTPS